MAELRKVQGQRQGAGGVPRTRAGEAVRDPHPTDLTLDNLLGASAALEERPDGVTTNVSRAGSQSCETKPICSDREEEEVGRGRPTHAEPPDGVATNTLESQGQLRETNPIGVAPAVEIPRPATIPSFQDSNLRPEVQGQARQTKPIYPGTSDRPVGY